MAFFAAGGVRVQVAGQRNSAGRPEVPDARALFSPDPTDVPRFSRPRGESPERCLALAVMAQALLDLRRSRVRWGHGLHPRVHQQTRAWFLSDDTAWPLSFRSICELFDWNPQTIRARVLAQECDPEPERHLRLVRRR